MRCAMICSAGTAGERLQVEREQPPDQEGADGRGESGGGGRAGRGIFLHERVWTAQGGAHCRRSAPFGKPRARPCRRAPASYAANLASNPDEPGDAPPQARTPDHAVHGRDLLPRPPRRGSGRPCEECRRFLDYAERRLEKCPYGEAKPTCARCPIHCYKPDAARAGQGDHALRRAANDVAPSLAQPHPPGSTSCDASSTRWPRAGASAPEPARQAARDGRADGCGAFSMTWSFRKPFCGRHSTCSSLRSKRLGFAIVDEAGARRQLEAAVADPAEIHAFLSVACTRPCCVDMLQDACQGICRDAKRSGFAVGCRRRGGAANAALSTPATAAFCGAWPTDADSP